MSNDRLSRLSICAMDERMLSMRARPLLSAPMSMSKRRKAQGRRTTTPRLLHRRSPFGVVPAEPPTTRRLQTAAVTVF
jgi:hypothetical protein